MAKIRSKQLADFVSSYNLATAATDILNAAAVSTEISAAGYALASGVNGSIDSLETQISGAVSAYQSADTSIVTRVTSVESINTVQSIAISTAVVNDAAHDASIDSIELVNSAEASTRLAADTSLTTRVSTEETTRSSADTSLTTRVSNEESTRSAANLSLTTRVSNEESTRTSADSSIVTAFGSADTSIVTAYQSADTSLTTRVSNEESTRTSADASIAANLSTELVTRASADLSLTTRVSAEESTTAANNTSLNTRVSTVESVDVVQSTAISSLAVAIMQDYDMFTETLSGTVAASGAPGVYTLAFALQDANKYLVQAYVNGVLVEVQSATANTATIVADYAIAANDAVTFVYQKA